MTWIKFVFDSALLFFQIILSDKSEIKIVILCLSWRKFLQMNSSDEIKMLLDKAVVQYNHPDFIENDPIQIPHRFTRKEDIEISGFLSASIAWGQRKTIIRNGWRLMERMDFAPFDFIMDEDDFTPFLDFVHRTFNGDDCIFFLRSLKNIYRNHGGLEQVFTEGFQQDNSIFTALKHFRKVFLEVPHKDRSRKHLSDVSKNSSAKRLNMFLRWMVRNDNKGVDFGLGKHSSVVADASA